MSTNKQGFYNVCGSNDAIPTSADIAVSGEPPGIVPFDNSQKGACNWHAHMPL